MVAGKHRSVAICNDRVELYTEILGQVRDYRSRPRSRSHVGAVRVSPTNSVSDASFHAERIAA
jgi:hypothetical protein